MEAADLNLFGWLKELKDICVHKKNSRLLHEEQPATE